MNRRLFYAITVCIAITTNAHAQNEHRMTIGDMFGLIDQHNRTIRAGKTAVAAADEGVRAARSQRLPDVGAKVSASYIGNAVLTDRDFAHVHGLHSPHFGNQLVVDARQTVYAGGAIDAGIRLAQLGADQARAELALNLQNQRFIALGQYLDLMKTANRERVVENNIALTQKLIDNITEKQQQGVALKNDITRYELQMERLRLSLTQLHNSRRILNHQLCNTLGLPQDYAIEPADDACSALYGKDGEAYWQTAAVAASPKLVMAGVGVQYQLSALFKSNRKLAQARLNSRNAAERKEVAAEQVNNDIQAAYTLYLQSYTELETQQKSVELARQNYQVVNNRYLNQLAIITDMIDATNMKLDAELGEVDARINIAYAYYKMKYIAGQL